MKTNDKQLDQSYTINVDKEMAQMIEKIAEHEQRKPRELLRLLLVPTLRQKWCEIHREEHQENAQPMSAAIFKS